MVNQMSYEVYQQSGFTIVCLTGDVDLSCSPVARKTILENLQRKENMLVDLSTVEYIDSSGIASLVEGYQVSKSHGLDFALIGVSDTAMEVLRLARLDQVFPIFESLDDRLANLTNTG
jgi:anti-sigma B factor antagonist